MTAEELQKEKIKYFSESNYPFKTRIHFSDFFSDTFTFKKKKMILIL